MSASDSESSLASAAAGKSQRAVSDCASGLSQTKGFVVANAAGLPAAVGGGLVIPAPFVNVLREDDSLLPANGFTSEVCAGFEKSKAESERSAGVTWAEVGSAPVAIKAPETFAEVSADRDARADSFGGKVTETRMVLYRGRMRL